MVRLCTLGMFDCINTCLTHAILPANTKVGKFLCVRFTLMQPCFSQCSCLLVFMGGNQMQAWCASGTWLRRQWFTRYQPTHLPFARSPCIQTQSVWCQLQTMGLRRFGSRQMQPQAELSSKQLIMALRTASMIAIYLY